MLRYLVFLHILLAATVSATDNNTPEEIEKARHLADNLPLNILFTVLDALHGSDILLFDRDD